MEATLTNVSELLRAADGLLREAEEHAELLDPCEALDGRYGVLSATLRHTTTPRLERLLRRLDDVLAEDWGEPI